MPLDHLAVTALVVALGVFAEGFFGYTFTVTVFVPVYAPVPVTFTL